MIEGLQLPVLFRDGYHISISLGVKSAISTQESFKSQIHNTISDTNLLTRTGIGDKKFPLTLLVKNDEIDELTEFLKEPRSFVFASDQYGVEVVNIYGSWSPSFMGDEASDYEIQVEFTTALDPLTDADELKAQFLDYYELWSSANESPATLLDRLRGVGESISNFTSNINERISGYTNALSQYAQAINQTLSAVGGLSTIITNTTRSVFDSINDVQAGLDSIISGISNAIVAIKKLPSDIENSINSFVSFGSQLRGLFNSGNPDEDNKVGIATIQNVADAILDTQIEYKPPIDPFIEMQKDQFLEVMLIGSCLINLYDATSQIGKWNKKDLDRLAEKTEKYYQYLISQNLGSNFVWALSNLRAQFYETFLLLQKRALKTYEYVPSGYESLTEIVYKVNGNLEYFNETKAYNNIIGLFTNQPVQVIRND